MRYANRPCPRREERKAQYGEVSDLLKEENVSKVKKGEENKLTKVETWHDRVQKSKGALLFKNIPLVCLHSSLDSCGHDNEAGQGERRGC